MSSFSINGRLNLYSSNVLKARELQAKRFGRLCAVLITIIALTPSFPMAPQLGVLPTVVSLFFSVFLVLFNLNRIKLDNGLVLFWVLHYIFLAIGGVFDSQGLGLLDMRELLIPLATMLYSFYFFYRIKLIYEYGGHHIHVMLLSLVKYLLPFLCLCIIFGYIEFNLMESRALYYFYKPLEKYAGDSRVVAVFRYPYYFSFFLFMLLAIVTPMLCYRPRLILALTFLVIVALNVVAQSSAGLLVMFLYLFGFFLLRSFSFHWILMSFSIAIVTFFMFFLFLDQIFGWVLENYRLYSLKTIYDLLTDPTSRGTYSVRSQQLFEAIDATSSSLFFLSAGWAREILLESWLSYLIYKYGIFYTAGVFFLLLYLLLSVYRAAYRFYAISNGFKFYLSVSLLLFFMLLPLSNASAFMLFTNKMTVLFVIIIALASCLCSEVSLKKRSDGS